MASTSTEPLRLRMMTERPEDPYEKDLTQPSSAEPKTGYFSAISSIRSTILSKFYSESGSTAYKHTGTSEYSDHKAFLILGDFLQPDTTTSLGSALNSILDILPDRAPLSKEVWSFGVLCFEIAQQIPYSHPSQQKLARLLEGLKESEKVTEKIYFNGKGVFYQTYDRLGEYMARRLLTPSVELSSEFINLHAFIANLLESHIFHPDPMWAMWAMHDAFEVKNEEGLARDTCVLIAAQWILWNGHGLFSQIRFLDEVTSKERERWAPGELYDGEPLFSLHRWRFWKEGFKSIAREMSGASDECKTISGKAAYMMDAYEHTMF